MAVTSAVVDSTLRTGSAGTTSTITGVTFGTAFSGRVVTVFVYEPTFSVAPVSATINGVAATITGTVANAAQYILSAVVPTGTSGNVTVTFGSSATAVSNGAIALTGAASATPSAHIDVVAGSGTINVGAGGSVVAYTNGPSGSWTGVSSAIAWEATDANAVGNFDNSGGALTGRTISYSTGGVLVAAAFDAAAGGGGISASLAATEATDTVAVSGKVKVTASLAGTEATDTVAVSSGVKVTGSFAVSEAADVAAFSGTVSNTINASLAAAEAADTAAISSAVTATSSLAATEIGDTASISAGIVVTSLFAVSEAADTAAISAGASVTGALSATEAADVISISTGLAVTASLGATEEQDVVAINAGSGATAALAATEAQDAASFAVTTSQPVVQVITGGGGYEHRKRKEREYLRAVIDRVDRELRGVAEVIDPQIAETARQAVETVSSLPAPSRSTDYAASLGRMSKSLAAIQQAASDIERMQHAVLVQRHAMSLARQIEAQRLLDEQDEEEVIALLLAS